MPDPSILQPQTDPFSQAYSAFCDALFLHPQVAALVKPGNQIRFDKDREDEVKWNKQTADRPELKVDIQGYAGGKAIDCKAWRGRLTLILKTDSGSQRANRGILPLWYACTKALANCANGKDKLRNVDIPFVVAVNQDLDGFAQLDNFTETDGEREWSSFCRVILTIQFDDYLNLP